MKKLFGHLSIALILAIAANGAYDDLPPDEAATPEAEVQWYLDTLRYGVDVVDNDDLRHRVLGRIRGRMSEKPGVYFPLLVAAMEETDDPHIESHAVRTISDPALLDKFGKDRVHEVLRGYVTAEREAIPSGKGWSALSTAVSGYRVTGTAEDAWDVLPLVGGENSYLASSALETISQIASPDIIPELEKAVRRRTEKYPEDYSNAEKYLNVALKQYTDKIRERHAATIKAADAAVTEQSEEEAPVARTDPKPSSVKGTESEASEDERSTTQPSQSWLWLGGSIVLFAGLLSVYKLKGR